MEMMRQAFCQRSGELRANPEKQTAGRCRLRAKDGSWRWFDAHATNRLSDPAIAGIVCYLPRRHRSATHGI